MMQTQIITGAGDEQGSRGDRGDVMSQIKTRYID